MKTVEKNVACNIKWFVSINMTRMRQKVLFFFSYIALTNFNYDQQEIKLIGCFNSEACQESIDNLS